MESFSDKLLSFVSEWKNDSPYIVAHTSGSTGKPKEIRLLKSDMTLSARSTCERFGINADSTLYLPLSLDYIAGKMMAVRSFVSGARLIAEEPSNKPLSLTGFESSITLIAIVPSQIEGLIKSKACKLIENVIVGGAPLTHLQEESLAKAPFKAFVTFGMTETCSHVALRELGKNYYTAMPDVSLETDKRDCLVINMPQRSVKTIVTNDIVELIDNKRFRWLGRYDNVINSGGIKIFPEEVERKLKSIITEREFVITSRQSEKWGNELILIIEGAPFPTDNLKKAVKSLLPPYENPKEIMFVNSLTRTSSGKIIRTC